MPSRKILVVDNSSSIRRMVYNVLSREGYEVFMGVDGEDAMEMAFEEQPDLLIVEDKLPDFETEQVIEGICSDNGHGGVRAIIMADSPESSERWSRDVPGVVHVLEKPFASKVLRQAVNACFEGEANGKAVPPNGAEKKSGESARSTPPPPPSPTARPASAGQPPAPFMTTPVHLPPGMDDEELELELDEELPAAVSSVPPRAMPQNSPSPTPAPAPVAAPAVQAGMPASLPAAAATPPPPPVAPRRPVAGAGPQTAPEPAIESSHPTAASPAPGPSAAQPHPQVKPHPHASSQQAPPPSAAFPAVQPMARPPAPPQRVEPPKTSLPPQQMINQGSGSNEVPGGSLPKPTPIPAPANVLPRPVAGVGSSPFQAPAGAPPMGPAKYELDVPAALVSGREVLVFISQQEWTGLCNIYCEDEVVEIFFLEGEVQMISSNNANLYVVDEEVPWREDLIIEAIEEQSRSGEPLFLFLNAREVRLTRAKILRILHKCGEEAVKRALATRTTRIRFKKMPHLPEFVQSYGEPMSMFQLLLVSYRTIQSWDRIVTVLPNPGTIVGPTDYLESLGDELDFNDLEIEVIQYLDGETNCGDIIRDLGRTAREVASALLGLHKLGLVEPIYVPDENEGGRWEGWM